ncbi:unnamed protein product [Rotaria sp. Silwood1]|nr:unnamed protein product [Rotaria sp. Silwood1]CAF0736481.1 unnamed protein product [Rotaria sp. Silwood1]CAF0790928.1 unnamed protein product [Rotaria sp. Silwood1]CAF3344345.1 unnamed protein product [Rotaria sp. Silwood1]CAF4869223.1 unnamed protein product [Rotaria sp. Silwood1]
MEYSLVQLNDLSDEILLIIFKKLEKLDVLYSLIGVNKRLNKIAHDSMFTSSLTLFHHLLYDYIYRLSDSMLDRFCFQILPEIHHKIKWLDIEASSMKRIFLSAIYPNLFGLGIYNIETENDIHLFKEDQIYLPSNEDIQHSFKHFSDIQIISCVNYFSEVKKGQCHVYSYPFTIRNYPNIANNFPGGLFTCVSESFPFMKKLTVANGQSQNNKQCQRSKNNNQNFLIIRYPHLKYLIFKKTHDDYVEQFLLDTKTYLPYGVIVFTDYKSLKRVTHKFTRKATRINCGKVTYICIERIRQFPKHFKNYFLDKKSHIL